MPPLILSLALLLLLLLALLALSNQGLVALSFLGLRSLELPLALWIGGAIALGFLLGIWLLLLLRLGQGQPRRGQGPRWRQDRGNMAYGPEDFTVVAEGYGGEGYGGEGYDDEGYGEATYGSGGYGEAAGAHPGDASPGYAEPRDAEPGYANRGYAEPSYSPEAYDDNPYGESAYADPAYEEDRAYEDRAHRRPGRGTPPRDAAPQAGARETDGDRQANPSDASGYSGHRPQTTPPDWDDEYREQWSEDELRPPEPFLIDNAPAPRLKRWFTKPVEDGDRATPSGNRAPSSKTDGYPDQPIPPGDGGWGSVKDNGAGQRDEPPRDDKPYDEPDQRPGSIYDADYRLVQPSDAVPQAAEDWRRSDRPNPPSSPPRPQPSAPSGDRDRPGNGDDWDIERDLDW